MHGPAGVSVSQLFLSLCVRDVAVPFVAATGAAVGTGIYLNKVVAKVTVWFYILLMVYRVKLYILVR